MNNELFVQLYKEAFQVGAMFHLTKFQTDTLEAKMAEVRKKFKGREVFLKKLIRNEVSVAVLFQKKLCNIQEMLKQEELDLTERKALYTLILEQFKEPLVELEQEAVRVRSVHQQHYNEISQIMEKRKSIRKNVEKAKKKLKVRGKKTHETLIEAEEKNSTMFKEIFDTKNKITILQAKMNKLNKDLMLKEEEKKQCDERLAILKEELKSVRYKKEHTQAVFDQIEGDKRNSKERLYEEEDRFKILVSMRHKTLNELKLCALQKRMHKVWETLFKLVSLYSETRLAKFQACSQESIQKILAVQNESSNLIQHIFAFFQSLPDGLCEENDG
ncbi:PREDICTED: coiled-coil domain-containing protein 178-like [Elephantulus edwardii]|uniref:coiled-coil domain-containing protein 178-like n=1 Tax=Elephantulus edwardii TaxID=28737 RepID=UPI0003F0CE67|nr:PREDICTED: coiled-coil domain-containing protein 178-like [Elephantulus edwardii]